MLEERKSKRHSTKCSTTLHFQTARVLNIMFDTCMQAYWFDAGIKLWPDSALERSQKRAKKKNQLKILFQCLYFIFSMTSVSRVGQVTHSSVSGGGDWDHKLSKWKSSPEVAN